MSARDRLRAVLRRAATDGAIHRQQEPFADPSAGAALMLEHIERTMLARKLVFEFDDGARFGCIASGRRLIRFAAPVPAALGRDLSRLIDGSQLTAQDAEAAAALLRAVCDGRSALTVRPETPEVRPGPTETGLAPAAVRGALPLPESPPDTARDADLLQALLADLGPGLRAALSLAGDEDLTVETGGQEAVSGLSTWAADTLDRVLSPDFPLAQSLQTRGILVFGAPQGADCHRLIAGSGGQLLIAEVDGPDDAATLAAWRRLAARD